jgi:di/tricarboxylate transporter
LVLAVFLLSVLLSSTTSIPASVLLLGTALLAVLVRAIDVETAYRAVDWRLLVLIGGMLAFGTAMAKSGADVMLAQVVVSVLQPWGGMAVVAGMAVLTVLLTQPMSNAAAAMVVLPVALEAARQVGVSGHAMGMAVMLAASISVITPFEPSCILVYGPGRYRFTDFLKVGGGLTLLMLVLLFVMLPWLWPLA